MTPVVSSCTIIFLVEVGNRDAAVPRQHLADPPAKYKETFIGYNTTQLKQLLTRRLTRTNIKYFSFLLGNRIKDRMITSSAVRIKIELHTQ